MITTLKKILVPVIRVPLILVFIFFNPLIRLFMKFDYIFFTYAAGKSDIKGYGPVFIARLLPKIIPVGYLTKKDGPGRGLMLGTASDARTFNDPSVIYDMLARLAKWRGKTGARSIAIGGQLPSIISRNGVDLRPPFVKSIYGTVFILDCITGAVVERRGLYPKKLSIGIIGVGFIGAPLARHFAGIYGKVIAVDNRLDGAARFPANVVYTDDHSKLKNCDVVILLTGRGDDAASAFVHFKNGIIVIDDAHPQLSREYIAKIENDKKGNVYKAAVALDGVRYVPKLPGFKANWVPGCAVEVITASRYGFNYNDQAEFNRLAVELGFRPVIEGHANQ